jgi:hypothetical protein
MIDYDSIRSIMKKKLRSSIEYTTLLLASKRSYSIFDYHDISEITIRKLKLQLELNSLLLKDERNNGDKKKLEEERKELQDVLVLEIQNGVEILNTLVASLRMDGKDDTARQFEILRDVRESELQELKGS